MNTPTPESDSPIAGGTHSRTTLVEAAAAGQLLTALERLTSQQTPQAEVEKLLNVQDPAGLTPWALAVLSGEIKSVAAQFSRLLDFRQPVASGSFFEFCLARNPETAEWAVEKVRDRSRTTLLSGSEPEAHTAIPSLLHLLAIHGALGKVLNKISKPEGKDAKDQEQNAEKESQARMKALLSTSPARPEETFPGKKMNVFGAAALGGHLDQIPESAFTRASLLTPETASGHTVHFLEIARACGKLEQVPGLVWSHLKRLQQEPLSKPEAAHLAALLEIHDELVSHYCGLLENNPGIYHREIPPDFKSEPRIRAIQRRNELKQYEQSPIPFEHLPQRFQQGEDALHSWSRPWIRLLAAEPHPFEKIPEQLRDSEEALEAWTQPWIKRLASAPIDSYQIPPKMRQNPHAVAARKQFHCGAVRTGDESALRSVPAELKDDPEMVAAMTEGWSAWLEGQGLKGWTQLPETFRSVARLREQAATLWIQRIEGAPVEWPEVPADIQCVESVGRAWKAVQSLSAQMEPSLAEVAAQPGLTKVTLQLWRNSNHWNRQKAGMMLIELREAPWNFDKLNKAAQEHEMIRSAAHEGILTLTRQHSGYFYVAPEAFRSDAELLDIASLEWLEALKEGRHSWNDVPEPLREAESLVHFKKKEDAKNRKEIREQKQASAEGRLRTSPHLRDEELTKKELKSASAQKLRAAYWAKKVQQDHNQYLEVPESLLPQPAIQTAMRAHWGPIVRGNPQGFEQLPERVKADEGIQRVYKIATRED
jgi:hypothetical protein